MTTYIHFGLTEELLDWAAVAGVEATMVIRASSHRALMMVEQRPAPFIFVRSPFTPNNDEAVEWWRRVARRARDKNAAEGFETEVWNR